MAAFYNEIDPFAAAWIRNLAAEGHITTGLVSEKSIAELTAEDVKAYRRCHFFAGLAGWEHALHLAGFPRDIPVWTGSCPCQPFSSAGKRGGTADVRHLWPEFRRLIAECRPPILFGEQVASPLGRAWLAAVRTDLEALGYAVGAADLCAASAGAPHIRQRLWFGAVRLEWVADTQSLRREGCTPRAPRGSSEGAARAGRAGSTRRLAYFDGGFGGDGDTQRSGGEPVRLAGGRGSGPLDEHWRDADWLLCRDGKWRSVEPGTFPLADGAPARVGRLRAYGNAIVPQVAASFIQAFLEAVIE